MSSRRLVRYLCIVALLFAQQVAYAHSAWHAGEQGTRHERNHDASFHGKLCGLHGAFCEVLGALPSVLSPLPPSHATHAHPTGLCAAWVVLPLPTPPSRGPPASS